MNMNKFSITLIAGALAAFMAATAPAQMISTQYAKKLVLADASASLVPLTLRAPAALTGAYSLTFPNAAPTSNGYLLSSATDGTLSWVDPTSYAFLTGVSHGATLTGAGTSGSPLDINLGNTNSWTAVQSFLANNAQGNVFVAAINAAASTINAVSVGIGLTDAQVSDNLTISGGTINNTPIGTTTASTGRFTTITGTSLPASSSSTDIVTSNGGDLETRTATTNATANTIVLRDNSGNFSAGTITAFLNGNVNGNINGNAVGFSGSLAGDVTGTQAATAVSLVGGSSATNVHSAELLANAATNLNTASTIVKRDGSGNFSAGTITAALSGNATTATTATNFSGSLSGNVTGTQGATVVASVGGSTAATVHSAELLANAATNANTASTIVKRDASGDFSAGTLTLAGITTPATGPGSSLNIQPATATSGASGNITITAGATTSGGGGQVSIQGGNATTSGQGGAVVIQSGSTASGNGNTLSITAGSASASASGNGGTVGIRGGVSSATSGNGGGVSLTGENAQTSGNGGSITITAGNANGTNKNGGNVSISVGNSTGSGTQGSMTLTGGNFAFQTAGAQLSFKSSNNTGVSTFQAGAQGTNNFNYTLPTSTPSVGNILTTTAVSGSSVTLGWSGTVEITSNSSGTPNANTIYKDNMINAWANVPAAGTSAIADFGITSYTHPANGTYNFTIDNALATNTHGAIQVTIQDANTATAIMFADAQWTSASSFTVHTWTLTWGGNFTGSGPALTNHAFFVTVVQGQ
jgi:hypothetical protein